MTPTIENGIARMVFDLDAERPIGTRDLKALFNQGYPIVDNLYDYTYFRTKILSKLREKPVTK